MPASGRRVRPDTFVVTYRQLDCFPIGPALLRRFCESVCRIDLRSEVHINGYLGELCGLVGHLDDGALESAEIGLVVRRKIIFGVSTAHDDALRVIGSISCVRNTQSLGLIEQIGRGILSAES